MIVTLRDGATVRRRLADVVPATPEQIRTRFRCAAEKVLGAEATAAAENFIDKLDRATRRRRPSHSTLMQKHQLLIDGSWTNPSSGEWFESVNPFTAQPWALVPRGSKADVDHAVAAAKAPSTARLARLTATARGPLLRKFGDLIAAEADRLAQIESTDNGKLYRRDARRS